MNEANQIFQYNGSPISFHKGDSVMVNATEMAKPFGKSATHWLRNQSTKEFINEYAALRNCNPGDLVQITNGDNGCTWMHEDVALEFARWLSPSFAIWCNDRIKELLTTGVTTVSNDDEAIAYAVSVLQKRLEQAKVDKAMLEADNLQKKAKIAKLQPKADFADAAFQAEGKVDIGQAAKILGLPFGRNTLFKKLKEKGIFFVNRNEPKQKYIDAKYFELTQLPPIHRHNHPDIITMKVICTQKGLAFINHLFGGNPPDGKLSAIK